MGAPPAIGGGGRRFGRLLVWRSREGANLFLLVAIGTGGFQTNKMLSPQKLWDHMHIQVKYSHVCIARISQLGQDPPRAILAEESMSVIAMGVVLFYPIPKQII